MRQASLHYTQDMKGKNAHIRGAKAIPVSYTHLTLPTNSRV